MNVLKKIKKSHKKGSILIVTLAFVVMSIMMLGFSYDIARVMYFKSYTKNLASVMALSIVNESGFAYHDIANGARVIIVYDSFSRPKKGFNGKYANSQLVTTLYNKNKDGMDKTYHVDPNKNITLNPYYTSSGTIIPGSTNTKRFEIGADGINGEVEVHITAKVDLYFLQSIFQKQITIHESAIAQPTAYVTKYYEKLRDEQQIQFEYEIWNF